MDESDSSVTLLYEDLSESAWDFDPALNDISNDKIYKKT